MNKGIKSMLAPSAEVAVNAQGGKQSRETMRFDLLDAEAMMALAGVLAHGAEKYGENNWRKIPAKSHINHALVHLFAYLAGDTQDDHLDHAFCRVMMARAMAEAAK